MLSFTDRLLYPAPTIHIQEGQLDPAITSLALPSFIDLPHGAVFVRHVYHGAAAF